MLEVDLIWRITLSHDFLVHPRWDIGPLTATLTKH